MSRDEYCTEHLERRYKELRRGLLQDVEDLAKYCSPELVIAIAKKDWGAVDRFLPLSFYLREWHEGKQPLENYANIAAIALCDNRALAARSRVILTHLFEMIEKENGRG